MVLVVGVTVAVAMAMMSVAAVSFGQLVFPCILSLICHKSICEHLQASPGKRKCCIPVCFTVPVKSFDLLLSFGGSQDHSFRLKGGQRSHRNWACAYIAYTCIIIRTCLPT